MDFSKDLLTWGQYSAHTNKKPTWLLFCFVFLNNRETPDYIRSESRVLTVYLQQLFPTFVCLLRGLSVCVCVHVMFVRASSNVSMFEMSSVNILHLVTDLGSALTWLHIVINLLLNVLCLLTRFGLWKTSSLKLDAFPVAWRKSMQRPILNVENTYFCRFPLSFLCPVCR